MPRCCWNVLAQIVCHSKEMLRLSRSRHKSWFVHYRLFFLYRGHFTEKDAAVVTRVILDVVAHCHKRGVAHRDLKPENFLLKRKALEKDKPLRAEDLRLVDFGLATFLQPTEDSVELLGSPFYIAPEVLKVWIFAGALTRMLKVAMAV